MFCMKLFSWFFHYKRQEWKSRSTFQDDRRSPICLPKPSLETRNQARSPQVNSRLDSVNKSLAPSHHRRCGQGHSQKYESFSIPCHSWRTLESQLTGKGQGSFPYTLFYNLTKTTAKKKCLRNKPMRTRIGENYRNEISMLESRQISGNWPHRFLNVGCTERWGTTWFL